MKTLNNPNGKLEWDKPLVTRAGKEAFLTEVESWHPEAYPKIVRVGGEDWSFTNDGSFVAGKEDQRDIFNKESEEQPEEQLEEQPKEPAGEVDWTKPIQTRDGRKARVLCTDAKGVYPVLVLIEDGQYDHIGRRGINGMVTPYWLEDSDIINVPEEKEKEPWSSRRDVPCPCWIRESEEGPDRLVTAVWPFKVETQCYQYEFPELIGARWSHKSGDNWEDMKECVKE